jgi:hypothetical protein
MSHKNVITLGLVLSLLVLGIPTVLAEESTGYNMIGDITPVLTFQFRDGTETYEFPVFQMNENVVDNSGVSFSVEGTVDKSPLLHEVMDEAYKYRLSNAAFDYQLKYFDVNADFMKNGESVISLDYRACRVDNYQIETLDSNDFESYFKEIGFAIVDKIDFVCSGVNSNNEFSMPTEPLTDFGESEFIFASDMRTSVTFLYDDGAETIQFPVFNLVSAYEEIPNTPEFSVEGVLDYYPLLYRAIDNSRVVSGVSSTSNLDFDALVEFTNGEDVLRGFEFRDCIVSDAKINTQTDKEEGFTGKSGFVIVHQLAFTCSGISPINPYYDEIRDDTPVWKSTHLSNEYVEPLQNTDQGLDVFTTFTFADGTETIEFSMFKQNEILTATEKNTANNGQKALAAAEFTRKATYPTLELRGIVGDYPLLYNYVDDNLKNQNSRGTQNRILVDVDVDIVSNGEVIRGFNYVNCRVTNYDVYTNANNEESYVKNKFALVNIFDLECQGYHPNNPIYDAMYVVEKANTTSSKDLRITDDWAKGFYVE